MKNLNVFSSLNDKLLYENSSNFLLEKNLDAFNLSYDFSKKVVLAESVHKNDTMPIKNAKYFYESCINSS